MKKLNWSNKIGEANIEKYLSLIGYNIATNYRSGGHTTIMDGLVIKRKNKKAGTISSRIVLKRILARTQFYVNIPLYLGGAYRYKITGFTYGKKIRSSQIKI